MLADYSSLRNIVTLNLHDRHGRRRLEHDLVSNWKRDPPPFFEPFHFMNLALKEAYTAELALNSGCRKSSGFESLDFDS